MAVEEEPGGGTRTMIDVTYEFLAPRLFDFIRGESEEHTRRAELRFDTASLLRPFSFETFYFQIVEAFVPRIKAGRPFTGDSLRDLNEADEMQKISAPSDIKLDNNSLEINIQTHCVTANTEEDAPCSEAKEEKDIYAFYEHSANVGRSDND